VELLKRLSGDLSTRFGRGFSIDNIETMRAFYLDYKPDEISETLSRISPSDNVQPDKSEVVANCDHLSRLKFSHNLPYAFKESKTRKPVYDICVKPWMR